MIFCEIVITIFRNNSRKRKNNFSMDPFGSIWKLDKKNKQVGTYNALEVALDPFNIHHSKKLLGFDF